MKDVDHLTPKNTAGFMKCRKKPIVVHAKKMDSDFRVTSPEGQVYGRAGDYLMYGVVGEKYVISKEVFDKSYNILD